MKPEIEMRGRRVSPLILALGTMGLLAGALLVDGVMQRGAADPSLTSTDAPFVLELAGPPRKHYLTVDSVWYGIDVRLCIRSDAESFTYVGATAELLFGDGTRTRAANGHEPGPRRPGTPSWLSDVDGWIDKATLRPTECVRGSLVFHSFSAGDPVRLDWNGSTIDLEAAFDTATSPDHS
jgi:hypothetical protein